MSPTYTCFILLLFSFDMAQSLVSNCADKFNGSFDFMSLSRQVIPPLIGKKKGDNGKIGIIGGSLEYTGAPYFAALTALKVGADLVFVITTEDAAPVIKSYSPELIVYPFLNEHKKSKIAPVLRKLDTIVIGPGLGREEETLKLFYYIVDESRLLSKPLVIDADGLFAVSQNISVLLNYSGAILTPNHAEAKHLQEAVKKGGYESNWHGYWGSEVAVLEKGKEDVFYSEFDNFNWLISAGGSGRRAGGQGDILAGALGTFYNWALKNDICANQTQQLKQSIASYAAALFTRKCNEKAFDTHGRSMTATDMFNEIHSSFEELFENYKEFTHDCDCDLKSSRKLPILIL